MATKKQKPADTSDEQLNERTSSRSVSGNRTNQHGVPVETYHAEKTDKRILGEGDIDEETLDPDAPFNKTYGRQAESTDASRNSAEP